MDNKELSLPSTEKSKSKDYVVILRGKNKGFFVVAHSMRTKEYNSIERRKLKEYEKELISRTLKRVYK